MRGIPTWTGLARLGRNRVARTSYFWLLGVPLAAKVAVELNRLTDHLLTGSLHLSLPFSWKLFYLGAILVACGTLIFSLRCPGIIRDHPTAADFRSAGKGFSQLLNYKRELPAGAFDKAIPSSSPKDAPAQIDIVFWSLQEAANGVRPVARFSCGSFYMGATLAFAYVVYENFRFVFPEVLP